MSLACDARRALGGENRSDAALRLVVDARGETVAIELPSVVARLLVAILDETAAGNAVTLVEGEPEITTTEAATLLNVSRPFLIGLVDNGILPARLVGRHRRLPLTAVLAYKAESFAARSRGLDEIVARDQALGLL